MKNLHIVIVTYNWPPRNAIGTHRPYAWAKEWSSLGIQVTVLSARKQTFDAPLDLNLPTLSGVDVIEVVWGGAYLGLGSRFLKNRLINSVARRIRILLTKYTDVNIEPREAWLFAALPIAAKIAPRADVVISTFGPRMTHQIGSAMKAINPRLIWVADYRDLWSKGHQQNLNKAQVAKNESLERETVFTNADMITAVSEDMVKQLSAMTVKPVLLIQNGFDYEEFEVLARLKKNKPKCGGSLRIVYTGMLYEGWRDPEPLFIALAGLLKSGKIQDGQVWVEFYGSRINVARSLAKNPDYTPFIKLVGHVPREQALIAQMSADLLLLVESPATSARGVLTGKVFEYIASGTPILSIGSLRDYEIPRLLAQTATGVSFEGHEINKLEHLILDLIKRESSPPFFSPDINSIMLYSRRRQSMALLNSILQTFNMQ